jgi:hypothetical protein
MVILLPGFAKRARFARLGSDEETDAQAALIFTARLQLSRLVGPANQLALATVATG